ncbi:MAG: ubiquitin-protein ligase peroxin 12 [Sclerophora amabilis]|nr:MAG: ubiquitin-protein ligase peroxin 12 [Sclerophora amabilis]
MEYLPSLQDGFDDQKPSLFELLSEQQLSSLLPPSLRYLLAVATHRHPRYLLRILNSFDEVYAGLMLFVERHYLLTYGGGFTENFYGLKRERVLRIKGGEVPRAQLGAAGIIRDTLKLGHVDVWRNLAVMVGLPYLKRKLDESYDIYIPQATLLGPTYNRDNLPPNPTIKQRFLHYYKWFLRRVYPSINAAYYVSILAFNLAYLFDSSKYQSPFLWLIGTRMRRLGEADHRAIAHASQSRPLSPTRPGARPGQGSSILNPRTLATTITPRLLSSLKILLPTSIFALKFLEWWHASDFARQLSRKASEGLELPPPIISGLPNKATTSEKTSSQTDPNNARASDESAASPSQPARRPAIAIPSYLPILTVPLQAPSSGSLCPICLGPVVTPTACQTGYVFCYTCIHKWVDGSHERQIAFMEGGDGEEGWGEEEGSRKGRWESGQGRCAVTGRRVLGGTEGLRRVMA